jgi:hypothetical protein
LEKAAAEVGTMQAPNQDEQDQPCVLPKFNYTPLSRPPNRSEPFHERYRR